MKRSIKAVALACAMLAASFTPLAHAQAFPTKPVSIVVPFPPGGVVDVEARLLADRMSPLMGQRVIVENRPGAGGTIGAAFVANAAPDGYVVLMGGAATHVFSPVIYPSLGYDALKSFASISQISSGPLVLVVPSTSSVKDMAQFIAMVREQGGKLNYASNGAGTYPQLAAELFRGAAGGKFVHVSYGGGAKAALALLSGEVGFSINHIPVVLSHIKSGKLRAIATTGEKRATLFPDLPTFEEAGFKGYEASPWFGLFAPAGTPKEALEKLSTVAAQAAKSSQFRERLAALGDDAIGGTPAELDALVRAEIAKWPAIVKAAGVKTN